MILAEVVLLSCFWRFLFYFVSVQSDASEFSLSVLSSSLLEDSFSSEAHIGGGSLGDHSTRILHCANNGRTKRERKDLKLSNKALTRFVDWKLVQNFCEVRDSTFELQVQFALVLRYCLETDVTTTILIR